MNALLLKNVYLFFGCFLLPFVECLEKKTKEIKPRIIGGHAAMTDFPFVASLLMDTVYGRFHSCGGSIINERTIVTAAHCLYFTLPSKLKVHVGENTLQVYYGKVYDVEAIHYHEKWNSETQDYDVGLVRITDRLIYGPNIQPIKLAGPKDGIKPGSYATVFGWGYTNLYDPKVSNELRMARVPIVEQSTCNGQMGGLITSRMLCAGFKSGGVDACQMDSGGPLVANRKLIGIVSWGVGCAKPNKPGVYTRVSELLPWIENILYNKYKEIL